MSSAEGTRKGIECCHDRIREVVLASISSARREALCRALADVLSKESAENPQLISRMYEAAGESKDDPKPERRAARSPR